MPRPTPPNRFIERQTPEYRRLPLMLNVRLQNSRLMRIATTTAALASILLIAACASPPPPVQPPPAPMVKFSAVLEPGCLLPKPELLGKSTKRSAALRLETDENGHVVRADLSESSGDSEVDAALLSASTRCRFSPAYVAGGRPYTRSDVPDTYSLTIQWPETTAMIGPLRCIRPDYPHAARRAEEAGVVVAQFRRSSTNNLIEASLLEGRQLLRLLRPLTLRAVTQCLEHPEVRESIEVDKWIRVAYEWRLEP
jgi:TonB family protein